MGESDLRIERGGDFFQKRKMDVLCCCWWRAGAREELRKRNSNDIS
jgi:hypothetical protein